jgi:hypothetical protein
MGAFKHHDVACQKPLTDATEQAQEIAAPGPNAFHRVGMHFANAIIVIIARPLATSRCMANRLVPTTRRGEVLIGRPFIGVDGRIAAGMGHHQRFQRGPISPFTDPQADMTTAAPDNPDCRRTIAGPGPVAARLIGPPARWVERVGVFAAFLAGVLIQFVGFGHRVGEWRGRGKNALPPVRVSRVVVRAGGCD